MKSNPQKSFIDNFSVAEFQKKVLFVLSCVWDGIKQIVHKLDDSNSATLAEIEIKRMSSIAEVQENEQLLQDPERRKLTVSYRHILFL